MITYEQFSQTELKVAKVLAAERVAGSEKLLRLDIDLGSSTGSTSSPQAGSGQETEKRQLVAGIGKAYEPEALVGKEIVIVANLEPRKLMGLESQGMLLCASDESGPVLLAPDREVAPGAGVK